MEAFAGIDVACAKKKALPVSVCVWRDGQFEPLPLRLRSAPVPPRGQGNARTLDPSVLASFADLTAQYLRKIESAFAVTIHRVAIDAPSDPKCAGELRREAEKALDRRGISCITTPSFDEFAAIRNKARAHLAQGGAESRLPHANQLWMLVGFELFRRLRQEWECLEVFPQAISHVLGAASIHKTKAAGLLAQLTAVSRFTSWPVVPSASALATIGHGSIHDRLDAYLSAWVASMDIERREALGVAPYDVIWIPKYGESHA